jgi:hypothetical protein
VCISGSGTGERLTAGKTATFKNGHSPLPIGRAKALAVACECTKAETMLLITTCLEEYYPEVANVLDLLTASDIDPKILLLAQSVQEAAEHEIAGGRATGFNVLPEHIHAVRDYARSHLVKSAA